VAEEAKVVLDLLHSLLVPLFISLKRVTFSLISPFLLWPGKWQVRRSNIASIIFLRYFDVHFGLLSLRLIKLILRLKQGSLFLNVLMSCYAFPPPIPAKS
jgi:hypothetical protein